MKSRKLTSALKSAIVLALVLTLALPCVLVASTGDAAYAAAGDYYSSVTATKGTALLGQLHDLIVTTHDYYTSYSDVKNYSKYSDPGKGNNTVLEFYTHSDIDNGNWDKSGGWNREHVWAQSISNGLWGTSGAGSDMHHIRPSEKDINNHRGNKRYGEVSNGKAEYTSVSKLLGGHSDSNTFEPLDNVKGDVARIVMYVYTHYNSASNVGGTTDRGNQTYGNLPVTKVIAASNADAAWQMLLRWNKLDPVDEIERVRNEYVYSKQGNRNPFIDNEAYADAIWGNGTAEKVDLQSLSVTPNALTLEVGAYQTLSIQATPSNANAAVTWSSSNTSVATVANGKVTAIASGSATITATSVENSNIKATAAVTVKAPKQATSLEISGTPATLQYQAGQSFNPAGLTVKVTYDDGTSASFTSANDLKQFNWVDAASGQALLTETTTAIKCKLGEIEQTCAFTLTVTAPPEQISGFVNSVTAISAATTLQQRFEAIKTALQAYNGLTSEEKANSSAQGAYQSLQQAIESYNAEAASVNSAMEKATQIGAYALSATTLAGAALIVALRKYCY